MLSITRYTNSRAYIIIITTKVIAKCYIRKGNYGCLTNLEATIKTILIEFSHSLMLKIFMTEHMSLIINEKYLIPLQELDLTLSERDCIRF
jgi:hypothetical protein